MVQQKIFWKQNLSNGFAKKIDEGLQEGKELKDIEVKFGLSTLKQLHASWVSDFYDYLTSRKG